MSFATLPATKILKIKTISTVLCFKETLLDCFFNTLFFVFAHIYHFFLFLKKNFFFRK